MDKSPVLLSTAYLPPVGYFKKLLTGHSVFIEKHEHFIKQTYRNRCVILGANGPIPLVIPVEKGRGTNKPVRDVRIYNHIRWQRNHWRTIFSAYNSSPFFKFFEEDFRPFYEKNWNFLFDLNMELLEMINNLLDIKPVIHFTVKYEHAAEGITDLRNVFSPKIKSGGKFEPYTQVFSEKFGFIPNLSIIDLIFNKGPESQMVLE